MPLPTIPWRDGLVALVAAALTALGGTLTGVLDYSADATEDEFQRLERVTDRLESRIKYWERRTQSLEAERDTLRQVVDDLQKQVANLRWRNRRAQRKIKALEKRMQSAEGVEPLPPRYLTPQLTAPGSLYHDR